MKQSPILILGSTGFLGTAIVKAALQSSQTVVSILHGSSRDSEFIRTKLYEKVQTLMCDARDINRLRHIIELYEIERIVQCAAVENPNDTHAMTYAALSAAARSDRLPQIIVPLRSKQSQPFFRSTDLRARFVLLPDLFGSGDLRLGRFAPQLFASAALNKALPAALIAREYAPVTAAARALLSENCVELEHMATGHELIAAVLAQAGLRIVRDGPPWWDAVRDTLAWYRTNTDRLAGKMPAHDRRAA